MPGGTSEVQEINEEVTALCMQVKADLEEKLGSACAAFEPKSFKHQVLIFKMNKELKGLKKLIFRLLLA